MMKHGITTWAAGILALGLACGSTPTADTEPSLQSADGPPTKAAEGRRGPRRPDPPLPPEPQVAEARDEFTAGMRAFDAGDYAAAIEKFRAANDTMHRPEILYNMAVCQERLGRLDAALGSYRIYLRETAPELTPERRQEVELKIHALEEQLGLTP
jgi:hypothetical protein